MIKKIKWANYKNLSNLELDFTDCNGKPYNTIIFAGENGTGKTTVLDSLATFLNLGTVEPFKFIKYSVNSKEFLVSKIKKDRREWYDESGFHDRINLSKHERKSIYSGHSSDRDKVFLDKEDVRSYGVAYSKARTGFKTKPVVSTTVEQLDNVKHDIDEVDDFTVIKQLIVDIDTQDNSDWMEITKSERDKDFESFKKHSKLFRFEDAFNNFFDKIKFVKVDNTDPSVKNIIFNKNGTNVLIDELSTGEKQVVFRGAQLLKNMNSLNGGVILIDEPELSMHPLWQEKILDYYRGLFTVGNNQTVQMFIATHSEYIVRSALKEKLNVLVIVLREENNKTIADRIIAPSKLPIITAAETNYLAFNIASVDYHIQLYGYLQTIIKNTKVNACDNYIAQHASYNHVYDKIVPNNPTARNPGTTETLCTFIRNAIDHPDSGRTFTDNELRKSIEIMRDILR